MCYLRTKEYLLTMSMNRVFLFGHLGADPEMRYTPSQMPICTLRLATNERRKSNDGEWEDHTEWHSVVVFGKQAENCKQYLAKGRQAFVEGRLRTNKWQDQDGKDRYRTEIVANNVQFVGGQRGDSSGERSSSSSYSTQSYDDQAAPMSSAPDIKTPVSFEDDDIPF